MTNKTIETTPLRRLFVAMLAVLALLVMTQAAFADDDDIDEIVIQINPSSGATVADINATYGTTTLESLAGGIYRLLAPDDQADEIVDLMQGDPRLVFSELNYSTEVPEASPHDTWAWGGTSATPMKQQYAVQMLELTAAHQVSVGRGAIVAVLDTGAHLQHPRLKARWTTQRYDFIQNDRVPQDEFNRIDDDGDGLIDEGAGHGTHVAGIINLTAPTARIMPVRVLDSDGRGDIFLVAEGIRYAVRHGADIINLSLGTPEPSRLLALVVDEAVAAGVVVVAAAGNLGSSNPLYPAADTDVISVTAIDRSRVKTSFANYGNWVDVAAPGEAILSAFPPNGYATWSGTSMAAPFVAGQAALIHSRFPTLGRAGIMSRIMTTTASLDEANSSYIDQLGAGLIQPNASLRR